MSSDRKDKISIFRGRFEVISNNFFYLVDAGRKVTKVQKV